MKTVTMVIALICMGLILLVSNILVGYPINDWITYGAFSYPLVFLITDIVNRGFGVEQARKLVLIGFIIGVILSLYFADMRIAIASGSAYFISQMLDITIFNHFRKSTWWKAPLISSAIASCVDTALFFSIAFVGLGLPWVSWAAGDLGVKLVMVLIFIPLYRVAISCWFAKNN